MPDDRLVEALHDEIDGEEELQERARFIAENKGAKLVEVLGKVDDIEEALAVIAAAIEDDLTDLTTEAVHYGRDRYLGRKDLD